MSVIVDGTVSGTGYAPKGHGSLADRVDLIVPNRALAIAQENDDRGPLRAPLFPVSVIRRTLRDSIEGQIQHLHEPP